MISLSHTKTGLCNSNDSLWHSLFSWSWLGTFKRGLPALHQPSDITVIHLQRDHLCVCVRVRMHETIGKTKRSGGVEQLRTACMPMPSLWNSHVLCSKLHHIFWSQGQRQLVTQIAWNHLMLPHCLIDTHANVPLWILSVTKCVKFRYCVSVYIPSP